MKLKSCNANGLEIIKFCINREKITQERLFSCIWVCMGCFLINYAVYKQIMAMDIVLYLA